MPSVQNRVYIIECRLFRFTDLTNFDFHFARVGQFNLFGRAENSIFVYGMNCLRHSRSVTRLLTPSQGERPVRGANDDARGRMHVAYGFSAVLTHFRPLNGEKPAPVVGLSVIFGRFRRVW